MRISTPSTPAAAGREAAARSLAPARGGARPRPGCSPIARRAVPPPAAPAHTRGRRPAIVNLRPLSPSTPITGHGHIARRVRCQTARGTRGGAGRRDPCAARTVRALSSSTSTVVAAPPRPSPPPPPPSISVHARPNSVTRPPGQLGFPIGCRREHHHPAPAVRAAHRHVGTPSAARRAQPSLTHAMIGREIDSQSLTIGCGG
eukprot:COSAG01_NODE_17814_length_1122_cov_1.264907_1_plen_202_part_01